MSRDEHYSPFGPMPPARRAQPGEPLFEFHVERTHRFYRVELRVRLYRIRQGADPRAWQCRPSALDVTQAVALNPFVNRRQFPSGSCT